MYDFINEYLHTDYVTTTENECVLFFGSYFYLYMLGDLRPEGELQNEVDKSSKKNKKAWVFILFYFYLVTTKAGDASQTCLRYFYLLFIYSIYQCVCDTEKGGE
jgi:hypothetical protein